MECGGYVQPPCVVSYGVVNGYRAVRRHHVERLGHVIPHGRRAAENERYPHAKITSALRFSRML